MIISDAHIHIGKSSFINQMISEKDILRWRIGKQVEDMLIFAADKDVNKHNQIVRQLVSKYSFMYGLHWLTTPDNEVEIDGKIVGCKYHGTYMSLPVSGLSEQLLGSLEAQRAILLVHCGRYLEGDIKSKTSYLHALEVAKDYPKLKVILAHMGGTDTTVCKKAIDASIYYKNVYFDTSGITTPYIIEYAVENIPSTRIIFGSDAPWCSYNAMVYTILDAKVPQTDKENIFHKNFQRVIVNNKN